MRGRDGERKRARKRHREVVKLAAIESASAGFGRRTLPFMRVRVRVLVRVLLCVRITVCVGARACVFLVCVFVLVCFWVCVCVCVCARARVRVCGQRSGTDR